MLCTRLYIGCLLKKSLWGDPPGPSGGGISTVPVPRNEAAARDPSCGHSANWSRWPNREGLLYQVPQGELNPSAGDEAAGGRGAGEPRCGGAESAANEGYFCAGRREDGGSLGRGRRGRIKVCARSGAEKGRTSAHLRRHDNSVPSSPSPPAGAGHLPRPGLSPSPLPAASRSSEGRSGGTPWPRPCPARPRSDPRAPPPRPPRAQPHPGPGSSALLTPLALRSAHRSAARAGPAPRCPPRARRPPLAR